MRRLILVTLAFAAIAMTAIYHDPMLRTVADWRVAGTLNYLESGRERSARAITLVEEMERVADDDKKPTISAFVAQAKAQAALYEVDAQAIREAAADSAKAASGWEAMQAAGRGFEAARNSAFHAGSALIIARRAKDTVFPPPPRKSDDDLIIIIGTGAAVVF